MGKKKKQKKISLECDTCSFCKLIKRQFAFWYECKYYKPEGWDIEKDGCPKEKL